MKHLTDRDIQDYLDNESSVDVELLHIHLKSCPACNEHVEQYKKLYGSLSKTIPWSLPDNFADRIVTRVLPNPSSRWYATDFFLALAGIIVSFGAVLYYYSAQTLLASLSGVLSWFDSFLPVYTQFKELAGLIPQTGFVYFFGGTLVFLLLGILDRFLIQHYFRRLKT